jgi:hypothetical protein
MTASAITPEEWRHAVLRDPAFLAKLAKLDAEFHALLDNDDSVGPNAKAAARTWLRALRLAAEAGAPRPRCDRPHPWRSAAPVSRSSVGRGRTPRGAGNFCGAEGWARGRTKAGYTFCWPDRSRRTFIPGFTDSSLLKRNLKRILKRIECITVC